MCIIRFGSAHGLSEKMTHFAMLSDGTWVRVSVLFLFAACKALVF